jgi:hypothetical protein
LAAEPESSAPLIPKTSTGHDPEPVPSNSHPYILIPFDPSYYLTNSLVAEPEGSIPLIPKPAAGHDPEQSECDSQFISLVIILILSSPSPN